MREIKYKFRAWDKINNYFVYHELLPNGFFTPEIYRSEYCDWEQFTGMRDIRGIEIYEKDIVKFYENKNIHDGEVNGKYVIGKISQCVSEANFMLSYRHNECWYGTELKDHGQHCEGVEVIGNIHETPDLDTL